MKLRTKLIFLLCSPLLLMGCKTQDPQPTPVATNQPTTTVTDYKNQALQEFQSFRTATSLPVAMKSLLSMERILGEGHLSHRDLSLDDNEIDGRVRYLARMRTPGTLKRNTATHKAHSSRRRPS
jgi:hypothetical protein